MLVYQHTYRVQAARTLNVYDAIRQAKETQRRRKPAVFWRRNREEWLVVMRLEDWIELYREWESGLYIKEAGD